MPQLHMDPDIPSTANENVDVRNENPPPTQSLHEISICFGVSREVVESVAHPFQTKLILRLLRNAADSV